MVELEFDYNQNKVVMQVDLNDYFSTIINKYYQKLLIVSHGQIIPFSKIYL